MSRQAGNGIADHRRVAAMIVGAQKSGTTSLLRYLVQHPALRGHTTIECAYFADDEEYAAGWGRKGLGRYFPSVGDGLLIGKSAVLSQDSRYIKRLAEHNSECLVILVLRDPVDRAFSSYRMERNAGAVVRPFEHIVSVLDTPSHDWHRLFVEPGHYARTLERLYEHFDPSQVEVLLLEDLHADAVGVCRRIFGRLGVNSAFAPETDVVHNAHRKVRSSGYARLLLWLRNQRNPVKRGAKAVLPTQTFHRVGRTLVDLNLGLLADEEIAPGVRAALGAHYQGSNRELERILGRDLSSWTGMTGEERSAVASS
jgi:sulfotransferase family protein